jgi:hypothetical protein
MNAQNTTKSKRNSFVNEPWQNGWQTWTNFKNWERMFERLADGTLAQKISEKNSAAAGQAQQLTIQGAQTLAQKTAERMRETGKRSWECMQEACSSETLTGFQECQNEMLSSAVRNYCNHTNDIAELTTKMTLKVLDIWAKRATETVAELTDHK